MLLWSPEAVNIEPQAVLPRISSKNGPRFERYTKCSLLSLSKIQDWWKAQK